MFVWLKQFMGSFTSIQFFFFLSLILRIFNYQTKPNQTAKMEREKRQLSDREREREREEITGANKTKKEIIQGNLSFVLLLSNQLTN